MPSVTFSKADINTCSTKTLSPEVEGASCTTFVKVSKSEETSSIELGSFFEPNTSASTLNENSASSSVSSCELNEMHISSSGLLFEHSETLRVKFAPFASPLSGVGCGLKSRK